MSNRRQEILDSWEPHLAEERELDAELAERHRAVLHSLPLEELERIERLQDSPEAEAGGPVTLDELRRATEAFEREGFGKKRK